MDSKLNLNKGTYRTLEREISKETCSVLVWVIEITSPFESLMGHGWCRGWTLLRDDQFEVIWSEVPRSIIHSWLGKEVEWQKTRLLAKFAEFVFKGDRRSKSRLYWSLVRSIIVISEEVEGLVTLFTAIDEPDCPLNVSRYWGLFLG